MVRDGQTLRGRRDLGVEHVPTAACPKGIAWSSRMLVTPLRVRLESMDTLAIE
jgi:hypothetical protein